MSVYIISSWVSKLCVCLSRVTSFCHAEWAVNICLVSLGSLLFPEQNVSKLAEQKKDLNIVNSISWVCWQTLFANSNKKYIVSFFNFFVEVLHNLVGHSAPQCLCCWFSWEWQLWCCGIIFSHGVTITSIFLIPTSSTLYQNSFGPVLKAKLMINSIYNFLRFCQLG